MKRLLGLCLLLPLSGAVFAAPPSAATSAQADADAAEMAALQTRMNALADRMAALSTRLGNEANATALHYLADSRRGMLGIAVSPVTNGLHVDAVTPGGPGERAGLKAGDTITSVDGKAVGGDTAAAEAALRRARAGQPMTVTVSRDGKRRELRVTPERLQAGDWQATVRAAEQAAREAGASVQSPEFRQRIQQSVDEAMKSADAALTNAAVARDAAMKNASAARDAALKSASAAREAALAAARDQGWAGFVSPWWGLNLAPLNPDLGHYFGTDHGVLVVSRDVGQFPALQPGDVITRVGGRAVDGPGEVERALRAASGERSVEIALRRRGKDLTLAMKVPPRHDLLPPAPPPPPPVPPAPSAPPSPSPPAPPPPQRSHGL